MQELQRTWDHEKKWMQRDRDEEQEAARKTEEAERPKTEESETVVDVKPTIPVPEVAPPQQLQPPPSQPPSQPPAQPQPQPTVQQRETERQSHILNGAKDCINAARKLLQPPPVQPPPVQPPVQSPVQPSPVQPPVQQQPLQKQPSSIGFGLSLGGGGTSMKPKTKTAAKPSITNVFNPEEDDEDTTVKKRKLVKIAYTDQQLRAVGIDPEAERKKLVKEIISSIPTEKAELFSYTVHWDMADQDLVDTRIRPWVDRKITDFMGEPEADLVAFVCQQVKEQTKPSKILQELEPVLDDEAKLFVMKLWRLIIYETEFKRLDKAGQ